METIQHQPKVITPCIRPKAAQSKEIISLGIQSDKDKITELEAFRDAARACLDGYSFEQIEKHACKILKSGI